MIPAMARPATTTYRVPRFRHELPSDRIKTEPLEPQTPLPVSHPWQEGLTLFAKSYAQGFERYFTELKQKPGMAMGVLGLSATLGTLMAMFSRHQRLIETGFVLGTLAYPLKYAVNMLPQISGLMRADKAEPSTPQDTKPEVLKPKAALQKSVNELVYQIFHVYLKPITFAVILSEFLSLPRTIRSAHSPLPAEATSIGRDIFRNVIQKLNISEQLLPIRVLDRLTQPLMRLGAHVDATWLRPLENRQLIGPVLQRLLR